jgi:hypothetical protein
MPTRPKTVNLLIPCSGICDQCSLPAVVRAKTSSEKYCQFHSPVDISLAGRKDPRQEYTRAIKLMTEMRFDTGLCGVVTAGPMIQCARTAQLPRVEGSVTIVLRGAVSCEKHGIRRMPELSSVNMGPVLLHDNATIWSRVLSNGIHSLRWYDKVQTVQDSDAMGALMRQDYCAYSHKSKYPGFPGNASLSPSIVRIPPLFDASRDDVVVFDEAMSELSWHGAVLSRIETRALFCSLYARLAEPMLYEVRRRIQRGVSFHVAGCFTFTEDATTHFRDVVACRFQEESCVACILQGLAPWDDYIRERFAAKDHSVFTAVISLFFGDCYKQSNCI